MKKIKSLISFVLMAAMMLTLIPAMGLNVMAADAVTSIELTNAIIDVVEGTTSYDVIVAAMYPENVDNYVYDIPKVTAVKTSNGETDFAQIEAAAVPGTITVTVGEITYTLNLKLAGTNIYNNGGAESGCWPAHWSGKALVTTNPGKGNNAVEITGGGNYSPAGESPYKTITGGKTYLGSQMIRTIETSTWKTVSGDVYTPNNAIFGNRNSSTFVCYDKDGIALPQSAPKTYAVSGTTWTTANKVIKMSADASIVDVYHTGAGNAKELVLDEVFLGEIVANLKVTDDMSQSSKTIAVPEAEATIKLDAKLLNQLGNSAGMENISVTWDAKGPSSDITVKEGIVTIPANATAGIYEISAVADVTSIGNGQGKVKGVYTIDLVDPSSLVALVNDITFSNVVVDNFSKDVFAYNVPVPVLHTNDVSTFKYDVPKLTAFELADSNDTVEVTEAAEIPGTTTIKVTHEGVSKTYTFNFYLAGNNMYENGGAEKQSWVEYGNGNAVHITTSPYKGNYAMEIQGSPYFPDRDSEVYVKDRVYLASSAIRRSLDETASLSFTEEMKRVGPNTSIKPTKYDEHGNVRTASLTLPDYNWVTTYRTYVITDENAETQKYADIYWTATYNYRSCGYDEDEKFMGELVANTIVKDSENNVAKEMFIPSENTTITLIAETVNNLGNKAGLGSATPAYTWSVAGNPAGITVDNGTVTVTSDAKEGTYYVEATAPTGIANGRQAYTKNSYEIKLVDESSYIGTLTSLKVSNTDIDFSWDTYEYDVKVPVLHKNEKDSYVMPKVTATGYKDANVEITYPEAIPGNITVEVEDGKTYTISLDFVGTNMYLNPGLEIMGNNTGTPANWSISTGLELGNDGDVYANIYQVTNKNAVVSPASKPTLEVGKMYIHQNLVRKADVAVVRPEYNNENQRDYVKMRLDGKNADGIYTYYNADGTTNNNDFVTLTEEWHPHIATMYEPTTANTKFCNIYVDWSNCYRYAIDDFWLSELTIADIEFDADKEVLATSSAAQTVNLTAKAVNSIGNLAGIKDNHTLTFRLGNDAPEGANITEDGEITVPANFNGTFEVEAVATPTWQGAAQKNFVKAYKIVVGDAAIWYEATDDGVVANLMYTGNETGYKFINAIYNVLANGELEFVTAYTKDVDSALTYAEPITLTAGQVAKTFFWKWEDITPLTKSFTFTK